MTEVIATHGNVRLVQDEETWAEFPSWGDGSFQLLSHDRPGWRVSERMGGEGMPSAEQFTRAGEELAYYHASSVMQRWLRIYYNPKATVRNYTGYSQGDYWIVVSMEGDLVTSDQIAAWAMGDVWRLALERRAEYIVNDEYEETVRNLGEPQVIERWIRDPDTGANAYGEADRLAVIADMTNEMDRLAFIENLTDDMEGGSA